MTVAGLTGNPFVCEQKGKLRFSPAKEGIPIVFRNVFVSKSFPATFISESVLTKLGCCITKKGDGGVVTDKDGNTLFEVVRQRGLYFADGEFVRQPVASLKVRNNAPDIPIALEKAFDRVLDAPDSEIVDLLPGMVNLARSYSARAVVDQLSRLHKRLSHMEFRKVANTFGIALPADYVFPLCDACVVGKAANHPHHEGAKIRASRQCQGLHIDFCGPFPSVAVTGDKYLLIFICDFAEFIWDFYTPTQSNFFDILEKLLLRLDNEHGKNCVGWIRSDNGKVFTDHRVLALCASRGIRNEYSAPYSQWQNGKAERAFNSILDLATAALHQSGLSTTYWPFATRLAVLAINRANADSGKNVLKGFPADYSKLDRAPSQQEHPYSAERGLSSWCPSLQENPR